MGLVTWAKAWVTWFLKWRVLREAGFTEQRRPPALNSGKDNKPVHCWFTMPSRAGLLCDEGVLIRPTLLLEASLTVPPHSSSLQPLPGLVLLEDPNDPIPPHSTSQIKSQERKFGPTPADSDSSTLDLTLINASLSPLLEVTAQIANAQQRSYLVPQSLELQDRLLVYEVSSTLAPRLHVTSLLSPLSSSPSSARLDLPFVFVTTAVLFSALVVSKTISTLTHESWAKNEDLNNRDNTTVPGNAFDTTQLFRPVQYKPHTVRLVFDPGGFAFALQSHTRTLTNTS
jgi:hypothetical protein